MHYSGGLTLLSWIRGGYFTGPTDITDCTASLISSSVQEDEFCHQLGLE